MDLTIIPIPHEGIAYERPYACTTSSCFRVRPCRHSGKPHIHLLLRPCHWPRASQHLVGTKNLRPHTRFSNIPVSSSSSLPSSSLKLVQLQKQVNLSTVPHVFHIFHAPTDVSISSSLSSKHPQRVSCRCQKRSPLPPPSSPSASYITLDVHEARDETHPVRQQRPTANKLPTTTAYPSPEQAIPIRDNPTRAAR